VFEKRVIREMLEYNRLELRAGLIKLRNEEKDEFYSSSNIITPVKSRRVELRGIIQCMQDSKKKI
jgi:hypothetical protein